ncbi:MAG: hypothetical protein ACT6RN_17490 [Agrobacterium sp.]|uniref:Lipoprotein n=1 Tax=Agrobacterium tomkonis CFBP 6623 TaxID=1183432 RepID=A0A1S7RF01_9HYPH|nr:hypothetical protein [Rhizobium sp. Root651]CUX51545.1 conserved hypothetical protein [Agrobacterium tomkonis CFBP 6623]
MRILIILCLLTVIAGCETVEQENRCSGYGFVRGTDAYANCLQRLDMSREYRFRRGYDSPMYDYD